MAWVWRVFGAWFVVGGGVRKRGYPREPCRHEGGGTPVAQGARVIGTASERNHGFLRSLGAEPVVHGDGLADRVRAPAPDGVTAAVDYVGGDAVEISRQLLTDPSRVASVVEASVTERGGHHVRVRPSSTDPAAPGSLADAGSLTVHIDTAPPLAEAAEAFRPNAAGRTRGKIVLEVA